ncbi:MAG: hypothetical protein ACRC9X_05525 [Bacteroidales bacterium]
MRTKFEDSVNGVLSKQYFLASEVTQNFVNWLIEHEKENKAFCSKLPFANLKEAAQKYKWEKGGDGDLAILVNKFETWRTAMLSTDETVLLDTCEKILVWGGGGKMLTVSMNKLKELKDLRGFFNEMNAIFNQDTIAIEDLKDKVNYMRSGFTKIYAALNKDFMMYDGRVGAALCYLVRLYLEENEINELPCELEFGYGTGQGDEDKKKNRNPNLTGNKAICFKDITQEHNRLLHFISNIKTNWLLENIANRFKSEGIKISEVKEKDYAFALQSALFMLGEELPK